MFVARLIKIFSTLRIGQIPLLGKVRHEKGKGIDMSRREIREHLFRMLFRKEFHEAEELQEQIDFYFEMLEESKEKDLIYLQRKFNLILEKLEEIDKVIEEASSGWLINRLGRVDLTLMRIATYEIRYDEEVPTAVAINEAVEIAKIFGEEGSPGFINGVLAKIA